MKKKLLFSSLLFFVSLSLFHLFPTNIFEEEDTETLDDAAQETNELQERIFYQKNSGGWAAISEQTANKVVQLVVFHGFFNWSEPYKAPQQEASRSSAFFIDDEGSLITCAHSVDQAEVMYIQIPEFGKERFEVKLIAFCPSKDIALIRLTPEALKDIRKKKKKIAYLSFGNSDAVNRAEEILTMGFPLGQEWIKSTTGVVSGIQVIDGNPLIQISSPINPGSSGGPSINSEGKVIGITTCGIITNGAQNVGYIVPAKDIILFLEQVAYVQREKKKNDDQVILVHRPFMGVTYHNATPKLATYLDNPLPTGIYVSEVITGSIGERMGIKEGDMLYKINEFPLDPFGEIVVPWSKDKISIVGYFSQYPVGRDFVVELYRKGKKIVLSGVWSTTHLLPIRLMYPKYEPIPFLVVGGMVLMELSLNHLPLFVNKSNEELLMYFLTKHQTKPVVVIAHILPNSVGERSRCLKEGMIVKEINGIAVDTVAECAEALLQSDSNFISLKTKNNEFFVADAYEVIAGEKILSKIYHYPIDESLRTLENMLYEKKTE